MNGNNSLNGVLNIYKDIGYTSHDVVAILRKVLSTKKIGHAGTLDPNVSGVLPICVGPSTKISSYLMESAKTYVGELTFGYETDTEDIWGTITDTTDVIPSKSLLEQTISKYDGKEILQTPPMYSSIKVKGKKLYELARQGKDIERKSRPSHIYSIKLIRYVDNKAHIEVSCSKGTYIRTLFKDIARDCNSMGTMSSLIRTSSGGLDIKHSINLEQLKEFSKEDLDKLIVNPDRAIDYLEKVNIPDFLFKKVINGIVIKPKLLNLDLKDDTDYMVYCKNEFIGIYHHSNDMLKVKTYLYRGN